MKKYTNDIHPWLFVTLIIILFAGVMGYLDLKQDIQELNNSILAQVFD